MPWWPNFQNHLRFVRCTPNASWTGFLAQTIFKSKMGLFNRSLKRKLFHDVHSGLLVMLLLVLGWYFDGPVNCLNSNQGWLVGEILFRGWSSPHISWHMKWYNWRMEFHRRTGFTMFHMQPVGTKNHVGNSDWMYITRCELLKFPSLGQCPEICWECPWLIIGSEKIPRWLFTYGFCSGTFDGQEHP